MRETTQELPSNIPQVPQKLSGKVLYQYLTYSDKGYNEIEDMISTLSESTTLKNK